jgi:2-polyprenyl-3-methyl-5-hydroxy-6-metoxy-1,4-benzoquinol methylase
MSMMIINLKNLSENLKFKNGVWYSKQKANVSYPKEDLDYYSQIEDKSFWFKFRNRFIVQMIKQFPPQGTLVEIGAGNGYVTQEIMKDKFDVLMIEPNSQGVLKAKERGLKKIICSVFEDVRFKSNSVPAMAMFDVLEHIKKDELFLKDLSKKLVKNGRLYLTVPAYSFLWSDEDKHAGHFRRYSKKQLFVLLKKADFQVEYFSFCFFILLLPIFLFRTIPTKLGLNRKTNLEALKREHGFKAGKLNKILEFFLTMEIKIIEKGWKIPFGSSCLLVASNTKPTKD